MLLRKQMDALLFIKAYIDRNGEAPSYQEIADGLNLASKSGIHRLVNGLRERGYITVLSGRRRSIEIIREPTEQMYAHRVDENQKEIVAAFRKIGYSVKDTSKYGEGFPDLVCGKHGVNYLIEVKDGKKPPSQRKLTAPEQKFKDEWRGQYTVIESIEDVIAFDRATRE